MCVCILAFVILHESRIFSKPYSIRGVDLYGAETWTLRAVDQNHLENFEMWCWRRKEKIIWNDHVRNEEVLLRVKGDSNILHTIERGRLTELVIFCVRTAFYRGLMKERKKEG